MKQNILKQHLFFALLMLSITIAQGCTWDNTDTCVAPTSITTTNVSITSVLVSWIAGSNETTWSLEYKKSSDSSYSAPITCNEPNYTLTNLTEATNYDVRIKAICDTDNESIGVVAHFKTASGVIKLYTITPHAGAHGSITPSMTIILAEGESQHFTFTPDEDYKVKQILVNDNYVGDSTSYVIENIQEHTTIQVDFELINSIDQNILNQHVKIYPNPTYAYLNVKLTTSFDQVEILDLLGEIIYTSTISDTDFVINVTDYNSGMYILRLSGKQGVVIKKFIKE
jgi:Fibronectin type III domain.